MVNIANSLQQLCRRSMVEWEILCWLEDIKILLRVDLAISPHDRAHLNNLKKRFSVFQIWNLDIKSAQAIKMH